MIATGFLVAYDFRYLFDSLPLVYAASDKIILAIDRDRKTLTGEFFDIGTDFFDWVKTFDTDKKIEWLEEAFFKPGLQPLDIIMLMRNTMLKAMEPADWYVQLDCDEYFLDFPAFVNHLKSLPVSTKIKVVQCKWKTLFKQLDEDFLTIGGKMEMVPVAINIPTNTSERNHREAEMLNTAFFLLHQSWARPVAEIRQKLGNWSHTKDFDTIRFFNIWENVDEKNYKNLRHFHPLHPAIWPYLERVEAKDIPALIEYYRVNPPVETATPALPWMRRIKNKIGRFL